MRKVAWVVAGVAAGVLAGVVIHRAQMPMSPVGSSTDVATEGVIGATEPTIRRVGDSVALTDVYTSQEAALVAAEAQQRAVVVATGPTGTRLERPTGVPSPLVGLIDDDEPGVGDPTETGGSHDASAVTQGRDERGIEGEVGLVVEMLFGDALVRRDAASYLAALGEDFRYVYDGGTPADPSDDRIYDRNEYERLMMPRLFDPEAVADVALSEPRAFEMFDENAAAIMYDYEVRLRGPAGEELFAGTASFLLARDAEQQSGDGVWRIRDWLDSPVRSASD